jgi:hypothetical protein
MTTKVKGAVILARRAFVEREFGGDAWKRLVAALPEEDRTALGGHILTATWYPFDLNQRLDEAIVEVLGGGDPAIFEAIGARSARENLTGAHRAFLTPGNPGRFMAATAQIYRFYYDTGRRDFEATGETSGLMTTYEAETFSQTDCLTVIGWYKEALGMCGARGVTVEEEACRARGDAVCRYRFAWTL